MLICKLSDQLGNQMFAYASIKSIAKDKGLDFKVYNEYDNQFLKNDTDQNFGCNLTTIFNIKDEIIENIPPNYESFLENTTIYSQSSLQEEALKVKDNTIMRGHYISPLYFLHRLSEVQTWFKFPDVIEEETESILSNIKKKYPSNTKFCSVHFRNALDYRIKGYMLDSYYWEKAAQQVLKEKNENIIFIIFYDRYSKIIGRFSNKYKSEIVHNSLIKDFNLISKCDYHIVCNSSFSIMAALMDKKSNNNTYCPSIWPVPKGYFPIDTYPSCWKKVKTTRNKISFIMGYIAPYLSPFKYILRKK